MCIYIFLHKLETFIRLLLLAIRRALASVRNQPSIFNKTMHGITEALFRIKYKEMGN